MGSCIYCREQAGFRYNSHSECKTEHWQTSVARMKNGEMLVLDDYILHPKRYPLKDPICLSREDLDPEYWEKTLVGTLNKKNWDRPDVNWLWAQNTAVIWISDVETTIKTHDSQGWGSLFGGREGKIEKKESFKNYVCNFALSNRAIHVRVLTGRNHPWLFWRFDFDKIVQLAQSNMPMERPSKGFLIGMSEPMGNQPQLFKLHITDAEEAIAPQEDLIRWLISESTRSQQHVNPNVEKSGLAGDTGALSDELTKLASLLEKGVLTEEEFTAAKAKLLS